MATFRALLGQYVDKWNRTTRVGSFAQFGGYDKIDTLLTSNGFDDLEHIASGSDKTIASAIVLRDKKNNLIIRIAPTALPQASVPEPDVRLQIPQMLQPLFVEKENIAPGVKLEILPNIARPKEMQDSKFDALLEQFKKEVEACRYALYHGEAAGDLWVHSDVGIFTYDDPEKPDQRKSVVMGLDPSLITQPKDQPPTCTSNYPTLEAQWEEQCKIVDSDSRLKQLLGGMPKKSPTTNVIEITGPGYGR